MPPLHVLSCILLLGWHGIDPAVHQFVVSCQQMSRLFYTARKTSFSFVPRRNQQKARIKDWAWDATQRGNGREINTKLVHLEPRAKKKLPTRLRINQKFRVPQNQFASVSQRTDDGRNTRSIVLWLDSRGNKREVEQQLIRKESGKE